MTNTPSQTIDPEIAVALADLFDLAGQGDPVALLQLLGQIEKIRLLLLAGSQGFNLSAEGSNQGVGNRGDQAERT